jgi:prolyl-tRNA synthetase
VLDLGAMLAGVARDGAGLVMPKAIAPFSVVFVPVNVKDDAQRSAAEQLYEQAKSAGCDAVLDDRDERPGVKFKDSELIGIPWRITLGKKLAEGKAEVFERASGEKWDVPVGEAVEFVRGRWDSVA